MRLQTSIQKWVWFLQIKYAIIQAVTLISPFTPADPCLKAARSSARYKPGKGQGQGTGTGKRQGQSSARAEVGSGEMDIELCVRGRTHILVEQVMLDEAAEMNYNAELSGGKQTARRRNSISAMATAIAAVTSATSAGQVVPRERTRSTILRARTFAEWTGPESCSKPPTTMTPLIAFVTSGEALANLGRASCERARLLSLDCYEWRV